MARSGTPLEIGPDDGGQRVDRFLRKYLDRATLPLVYKLLRTKQVVVNGRKAKPEQRLEEGDVVTLFLGARVHELKGTAERRSGTRAENAPDLNILYEDEHVLAVDKPARLLVHGAEDKDEPTLIDAVLDAYPERRGLTFRPALAHRLDRDTSGVVLVGLSARGLRGLEESLRERRVGKTYWALVVGVPNPPEGSLDAPLRRDEFPRGEKPVTRVGGSQAVEAVTTYRVLGRGEGYALVQARPLTGRTHQIRVHFAHGGHPILGDATYGDRKRNEEARGKWGLWRHFLHARRIELDHPVTGESLRIESPLPDELARVLKGLRIKV
ncbi:MAG: RluA family pseudouridine synthase [Planctomycetota bacterium]|jgi:RluA family pseudouridine synthase